MLTFATPESASFALTVTLTTPLTVAPSVGDVIATLGAAVSNWMSCERVVSTLPALSQERYLTVVVSETVKGALYAGLETVGSEPSSV
jgi:hypothetical protein